MNYYYDALINLQDNYIYFYEWDESDLIYCVKKIMIFNIEHNDLINIIVNKIQVNDKFLNSIDDKTKLKENITLKYACVFSDNKNAVVVEFNDNGESIAKSSLLLDDELNICEISYGVNKIKLEYKIIEKEIINYDTIQTKKIKKYILTEINNLFKNKNYSKLKFLYLSWFNYIESDVNKIYINIIKELEKGINDKSYKIYELIKLSYNNV